MKIKFIVPIPDSSYYIQQALIQCNNFSKFGYDADTHYVVGIVRGTPNVNVIRIAQSDLLKAKFHLYQDQRESKIYSASLKPYLMYRYFSDYPQEKDNIYIYLDPDVIFLEPMDFSKYIDGDAWYGSNTGSYLDSKYIKPKGEGLLEEMCAFAGIDPNVVVANDNNIIGAQYLTKNNTAEFWKDVYQNSYRMYKFVNGLKGKYFKPEMKFWLQVWTTEMWITLWELWKRGIETKHTSEWDFHWADHKMKDRRHKIFHNAGIAEQDQAKTEHFAKRAYEHKTPFNKVLPVSENSLSILYVNEIRDTEKNYPSLIWD